jgi:cobalt-zinc-cadmium resistance protein CzcA
MTNGRQASPRTCSSRNLQKEFNDELPGVEFNFSQYIQDNIEEALSGVKGANSVKIIGRDYRRLSGLPPKRCARCSRSRHRRPGNFPCARAAEPEYQGESRKGGALRPQYRRRQHRRSGGAGRRQATTLLEGDRQWNVVGSAAARISLKSRSGPQHQGRVPNAERNQRLHSLTELADITLDTGASYIYHESGERYIPVKFSVRDRDLAGAVAEAQKRIAENVKLPGGYRIAWAGEFEACRTRKRGLLLSCRSACF